MAFLPPFAVTGQDVQASQYRQHLYQTVKGGTGILSSDSLKVVGIAGSPGVVGIMPGLGAISVPSRLESYQVSNLAMDGDALITVPPNTADGPRNRFVIVEVTDPQFEGQSGQVTPRVVATLAGLTKPYLELGTFQLPAGAGFDVTIPITDRRRVVFPQQHTAAWVLRPTVVNAASNGTGWQDWFRFAQSTNVPDWTGRMMLRLYTAGISIQNGMWQGAWRITFKTPGGNLSTEEVRIREDSTSGSTRFHVPFGDLIEVPANRTGDVEIWVQTFREAGPGTIAVDNRSTMSMDATYIQAAR